MDRYVAGVDIGGTTVKIGLFPVGGHAVKNWEIKTRGKEEINMIWEDIKNSLYAAMEELEIPKEALVAAGVGIPGPITEDGHLLRCVNLGMGSCYPAQILSSLLDVPVKAGNDANVATLGEVFYGAAKGYDNAIMFTLGTGVGGGIVTRGKMVAGNRGLAGEVGHMVVNTDETEFCNCGNQGCLEQYASATGVVRMAKKILSESVLESTLREVEDLSSKAIFDAAKEGDALALQVLDVLGKYMGMAVSYSVAMVDPDVVIIGGGVSKAGQILLDVIEKHTKKYTHLSDEIGKLALATLGNDAGIYGAAVMAMEFVMPQGATENAIQK